MRYNKISYLRPNIFNKNYKIFVKRTRSNIFIVFSSYSNKVLKVISGGMIKIKGLKVRRKKLFFGTVSYMAESIGRFILDYGVKRVNVFFSRGCRRYFNIILQKFLSLGLIILSLD